MNDRPLPHSTGAETALLGAAMLNPQEVLADCVSVLGRDGAAFYDERNRTVYSALSELYERGAAIDLVTLTQELHRTGSLEAAGGPARVSDIQTATPSAGAFREYLKTVADKAALRNAICEASNLVARCYQPDANAEQLLSEYSEKITSGISNSHELITHRDALGRGFDLLEKLHFSKNGLLGISTGYARMDRYILGLKPGEFVVLGGPPSEGKTAFALNLVRNLAEQSVAVGVLTMEQSETAAALRVISAGASEPIYQTPYTPAAFARLGNEHSRQREWRIFYDPRSGLGISRMKASLRRMRHRHGIKVAVVDYLQLAAAENAREGRTETMTAVSLGLKTAAKELGITVIALSQLNRDSRKAGRRASLHDLRQSGQIEQDADIALLLQGEASMDDFKHLPVQPTQEELENVVIVEIAKARDYKTGSLPFVWNRPCFRFDEWMPRSTGQ